LKLLHQDFLDKIGWTEKRQIPVKGE